MVGFKPRISGVGSDRSANCATTKTTPPNLFTTRTLLHQGKSIVLYLVLVLQTKDSRTSNKDLINVEENILMGFRNTYCFYC